ncbi:hypothetical protein B7494_g5435 [Chlorociboria aeruginascens]|nr:hypothetical protein B7494_g5435 [Chlorociboria aeruginascens]
MSTSGPAHRSVASIRPGIYPTPGVPASPHTPLRGISSAYGSPSAIRAEDECIIIELGSRYLRAGFAGDAVPKAVVNFGPEEQRRAGDYRRWKPDFGKTWRNRVRGNEWGEAHELWTTDLRELDLGWVGDKIERAVREAFAKYLLIDSRPRRMVLTLPSALPLPLLSTILDTLFNNFQPPNISLLSSPALSTVAAGLRSALVVDIGWAETVVTGIYEFREVQSRRSIRATKLLSQEMRKVLVHAIDPQGSKKDDPPLLDLSGETKGLVSFEECEEITTRLAWSRSNENAPRKELPRELTPVKEEDEFRSSMKSLNINDSPDMDKIISIPLKSADPPTTVQIPFSNLSNPCEDAFFASSTPARDFDDEELPLHLLIYRSLLHLPVDIRSMCMSRIIFVGGGSNIIGLKSRVLEEVAALIEERGWDPVCGKAVEQLRSNPKLRRVRSKQAAPGPLGVLQEIVEEEPLQSKFSPAGFADQELDPIEDQVKREANKGVPPIEYGYLRAVDSLGAWCGASLLSQLKIPAVSVIDREQWLQHGAAGASRNPEVSIANQRQSMGPNSFKAAAGDRSSWTLGLWG